MGKQQQQQQQQGRNDQPRASASGASTSGDDGRPSSTHGNVASNAGDASGSSDQSGSSGSAGDQQEGMRTQSYDQGGQRNEPQGYGARAGTNEGREMGQDFDDSPRSQGGWQDNQRSFGAQSQSQGGRRRPWRRSPQSARDVMTRNPRTVRPTDTVQQIAQLMIDEDTGIIPVVDNGRLVGVVTDRDIVCRLVATGADLRTAKAGDVMTTEVECVTEDESLQEVLEVMGQHQIRRVAVVASEDRLVGIISMADLAREADVDERLQEAFEEISAERSFWSKMR